nr:hypothetical protein [Tanacetum cinerariifolium]
RVVSVNGVPWVGDGGVSGISLPAESSVDERNGEVAGSGETSSDPSSDDLPDSSSDHSLQASSSGPKAKKRTKCAKKSH